MVVKSPCIFRHPLTLLLELFLPTQSYIYLPLILYYFLFCCYQRVVSFCHNFSSIISRIVSHTMFSIQHSLLWCCFILSYVSFYLYSFTTFLFALFCLLYSFAFQSFVIFFVVINMYISLRSVIILNIPALCTHSV